MGVFARMMAGLIRGKTESQTFIIGAIYLKAHRTASSLREKKDPGRLIGRTKGGMNKKVHAVDF